MWYRYVGLIFEIAAFLFAIIYWNRYLKSSERIFLFLLGYTVVTELLGLYFRCCTDAKIIFFIYNSYNVVSFIIYFYWFSLILKRKRFVYLFLTIFLLLTLYSALFKSFCEESWKILMTSGSIFTIICVGIYYLELVGLNIIFRTTRSQTFWIASGLLIYYLGYLPLNFYQFNNMKFLYNGESIYYGYVQIFIHTFLCFFLYGFYIISFICIRKK